MWRDKIRDVNNQFTNVFFDKRGDGRLWVRYAYIYEPNTNEELEQAMLAYNYRQLGIKNLPTISRIKVNHKNRYISINHDYYVFYGDRIEEFVHWPLPKNY